MGNISIKVNLETLKHVKRNFNGKNGEIACLVIPIDENKLIAAKKGTYLNLTAIEIKDKSNFDKDNKNTHLIKQNFEKEFYEKLSDKEKQSWPIIGNAIDWDSLNNYSQASNELKDFETNEEGPC